MSGQGKKVHSLTDALRLRQKMLVRIDNLDPRDGFVQAVVKVLRRSVRNGRKPKKRASTHCFQDSWPSRFYKTVILEITMTEDDTQTRPGQQANRQLPDHAPDTPLPKPWRTEGLPKKQTGKSRPRWWLLAACFLGYLVFFGLLTVQDRLSGPEAVPYTEFKAQVANANVKEVFARGNTIQGALKKSAPAWSANRGR